MDFFFFAQFFLRGVWGIPNFVIIMGYIFTFLELHEFLKCGCYSFVLDGHIPKRKFKHICFEVHVGIMTTITFRNPLAWKVPYLNDCSIAKISPSDAENWVSIKSNLIINF